MESHSIPPDQLTVEQAQDEIRAALNGWMKKAADSHTGSTIDLPTSDIGHALDSLHTAASLLRPHNEPLGRRLDHASEQADNATRSTDQDRHMGLERTFWQCAVAYLRQAERFALEGAGADR